MFIRIDELVTSIPKDIPVIILKDKKVCKKRASRFEEEYLHRGLTYYVWLNPSELKSFLYTDIEYVRVYICIRDTCFPVGLCKIVKWFDNSKRVYRGNLYLPNQLSTFWEYLMGSGEKVTVVVLVTHEFVDSLNRNVVTGLVRCPICWTKHAIQIEGDVGGFWCDKCRKLIVCDRRLICIDFYGALALMARKLHEYYTPQEKPIITSEVRMSIKSSGGSSVERKS